MRTEQETEGKRIQEIGESLPYDSYEEARNVIRKMELEKQEKEEALEAAKAAYQSTENEISACEASIRVWTEQQKDRETPEEEKHREKEELEQKKQEEEAKLNREKQLQQAMLGIQKKYGKNAVLKGMNLEEGATARERNRQIGGHKA